MYDLRLTKIIDLDNSECLKEETTFKFKDSSTEKKLIAKFISYYDDSEDVYLVTEFKKLALLSGEPEIATVYYLATGKISNISKSCYIMDYIDGQTLKQFLDNRETIIYEVLLDLTLQLASGLEKAHNFEIYHSDLHNENILINEFGYLKLIDFLWWDYNLPKETNQKKDITDFKNIVSEFYLKCKESDKIRFKIIYDCCKNINSFKGLKKEIEMLNEISFDLSLINEKSLTVLSKLFELTTLNQLHMAIESKNQTIPEQHIPELNETEKGYLKNIKSGSRMKFIDGINPKIQSNIHSHFSPKLFSLKQVDLIDWNIWITNKGEPYEGPYEYNFRIWFTSKFLKWKKINELLSIVESTDKELEELLLE
ncbi:protein kinase [Flavobacteriaceae bacterium KMM 6897]|nr:protein kinase [Flavobacteriaceae bacterium KMM 6897]